MRAIRELLVLSYDIGDERTIIYLPKRKRPLEASLAVCANLEPPRLWGELIATRRGMSFRTGNLTGLAANSHG